MPSKINKIINILFSLLIRAARKIPKISQLEYETYAAIEQESTKQTTQETIKFIPFFVLNKNTIRQSLLKNSNYRVIDIKNLTESDHESIKSMGCSLQHIARNSIDSKNPSSDETIDQAMDNINRSFQLETIRNRYMEAICPKTGITLKSNHSILAESGQTLFYLFTGKGYFFYLAVGRAGMGYINLYMYFPQQQIVIILGDKDWAWLGRWEIDQLRSHIIFNYKKIIKYINASSPPALCILIDQAHFAHHLWNTITGLNKIISTKTTALADNFLIVEEPLGPIHEIFPEIDLKYTRIKNTEIVDFALTNNLFLIRVGERTVTTEVIERIHRVALKNTSEQYIASAENFRQTHWPILWATIRTGNRTWVSQAEGIAHIANQLIKHYPNFGLIIDGYAVPYGHTKITPHVAKIIEQEQEVVCLIKRFLDPSIDARFLVGKPIFESIIYSRLIDFYMAHHGAIQNKIAWFSQKPGIVHANKAALAAKHCDFTGISSGVFPVYLDSDKVTDIADHKTANNLKWDFLHSNYDFDHQYAFENLKTLIDNKLN